MSELLTREALLLRTSGPRARQLREKKKKVLGPMKTNTNMVVLSVEAILCLTHYEKQSYCRCPIRIESAFLSHYGCNNLPFFFQAVIVEQNLPACCGLLLTNKLGSQTVYLEFPLPFTHGGTLPPQMMGI